MLALVMFMLDAWAIAEVRRLPKMLIAVFDEITDFGKSGWFLLPLGIFLLGVAAASPMLSRVDALILDAVAFRAGFLLVAIAVPGLFATVIKRLIGRARPYVTGGDAYVYSPFVWRPEYASLPSGHAVTSFAAAVAIGAIWPRVRWVMWAYAIIIAVSRVVVSAHYPSDVMASAVVGILGALLARNYFAARGLGFGVRPDGGVYAFPPPSWWRIKRVAEALLAPRSSSTGRSS